MPAVHKYTAQNVDQEELLRRATAGQTPPGKEPPKEDPEELDELEDEELKDETATAAAAEEARSEDEDEVVFSSQQQGHIQGLINRTVAIERRRREREFKNTFGTSDLNQIAEVHAAGQAIVTASGRSPKDLVKYVRERAGGVPAGQAGSPSTIGPSQLAALESQLAEIRAILGGQYEAGVRDSQTKVVRQEFGKLFDQYQLEIEDKADELGLPLIDAAAIVLRPHLRTQVERRADAKRKNVRTRSVASTGEGGAADSGGNLNLEELLSPRQKQVARKMGLTFKDYAQQLKEIGELERP